MQDVELALHVGPVPEYDAVTPFTLPDNPYIQCNESRHVAERYESDGRVFLTTGERRRPRRGEFVLGLFGVAQVNRDLGEDFVILREDLGRVPG